MTNEDREKTINFILEQQAKLTVDMQQLAEAGVAAEKRISRLEGAIYLRAGKIYQRKTKREERTDLR